MKYEYIDSIPRDFPTIGIRGIKKGDTFESNIEINSPFVKKADETQNKIAEEIKAEEAKIEELKSEELKGDEQ